MLSTSFLLFAMQATGLPIKTQPTLIPQIQTDETSRVESIRDKLISPQDCESREEWSECHVFCELRVAKQNAKQDTEDIDECVSACNTIILNLASVIIEQLSAFSISIQEVETSKSKNKCA